MIKTSKINIKANYLKIDKDYDIFKIGYDNYSNEKNKDNFRSTMSIISDSLSKNIATTLAVLYRYGGYMYAIFEKDKLNIYELKNCINSLRNNTDIKIDKIKSGDMYLHELCQLFFNMIPNLESYEYYNNLSGKLHYKYKINNNIITAYKISVEQLRKNQDDYNLKLDVESYHLYGKVYNSYKGKGYENDLNKIISLPKYFINEENKLERAINDFNDKTLYICRKPLNSNNNKNIVESIKYINIDEYNDSKFGILHDFMNSFKDCFSDYINIELCEFNVINGKSKLLNPDVKIFNNYGINIIDKINNIYSKQIIEELKTNLKNYEITKISEKNDYDLNVEIIHDKEYYEQNNQNDIYIRDLSTQHITYETVIKDGVVKIDKNIINKTLCELLIKRDVQERKLRLYDWILADAVKYVIMDCLDKKTHKYIFYEVIVYPNKELEFNYYTSGETYEKYYDLFKENKSSQYTYNVKIEMLILYKDKIIGIYDTSIIALPDLDIIYDRLNKYNEDAVIEKNELIDILENYLINCKDKDAVKKVINDVKNSKKESYKNSEIFRGGSKKENEPLFHLNHNNELAYDLLDYINNNYDITINLRLKRDVLKIYQHIHILEYDSNYYYYVGKTTTANRDKENKAMHIRLISFIEGKKDFNLVKDICNQLEVGFVNNNQYTVLPFLKKYLNEYKRTRNF